MLLPPMGPLKCVPGAKIVFLILRHQLTTVQAVLTEEEGITSQNMVRWAEGIARESVVLVDGVTQEPDGQTEVKSATVRNVEIKVDKVCSNNRLLCWLTVLLVAISSSLSLTRPPVYRFKSNRCPARQTQPTFMSETILGTTIVYSTSVYVLITRLGGLLVDLLNPHQVFRQSSNLPYQVGCMRFLPTSPCLQRVHRNPFVKVPGVWYRIWRGGLQSRLLPPSHFSRAVSSTRQANGHCSRYGARI